MDPIQVQPDLSKYRLLAVSLGNAILAYWQYHMPLNYSFSHKKQIRAG